MKWPSNLRPQAAPVAQTPPAAVAPSVPVAPSIDPAEVHQIAVDLTALRQTVAELVDLQPDAILAQMTPVAVAIAHQTKARPASAHLRLGRAVDKD